MSIEALIALAVASILALLEGLALWHIKRTSATLESIRQHLATLNGRVGKSETWMEQHESEDDQRHKENLSKFDSIFGEIRKMTWALVGLASGRKKLVEEDD